MSRYPQSIQISYRPLRRQRRVMELTQQRVGEIGGVSRMTILRAEAGRADLPVRALVSIARGLGVPYGSLFEIIA